jgi:hypothetical protein
MIAKAIDPATTMTDEDSRSETLARRLRVHLQALVALRLPITYGEVAKGLQLSPPNTIRQVREALQQLMAEDASAKRPFIAAMVISNWRGGMPAPDFFDCAARLGRFAGDAAGPDAKIFYVDEFKALLALRGLTSESCEGE